MVAAVIHGKQRDGLTDMMNQRGAFHNYVNVLQINQVYYLQMTGIYCTVALRMNTYSLLG